MKLIARTLAILAAALVVVGITFAFAQSSYAQSLSPARTPPAELAQSQARPARGPGGEHNESASLFGLVEVAKNLAIVGVICALVAGATRLKRGRAYRVAASAGGKVAG